MTAPSDDRASRPPPDRDGATAWYSRVLGVAMVGVAPRDFDVAMGVALRTLLAIGALSPAVGADSMLFANVEEAAHRLARAWVAPPRER